MWVGSFLDRWDERQAAEDDGNKVLDPFVVGASLAFSDLNKDAPLSELAARVARQMRFSDAFFATGPTASNYSCKDDVLTFASDLTTKTVSNNEVFARTLCGKIQAQGDRRVASLECADVGLSILLSKSQ